MLPSTLRNLHLSSKSIGDLSLEASLAPELPNTTEGTLTLASIFGTAATLKCLDQALV
jgi:hypothetical protein